MSLYYTIRNDGQYDTWDGDTGFYMGTSPTGPNQTQGGYNPAAPYYPPPPTFRVVAPGAGRYSAPPPERTVSEQVLTLRWCIPWSYTPIVPDPGGGAPSGGYLTAKWVQTDWAVTIYRVSNGQVVASASGVGTAGAVMGSNGSNSGTSTVVMSGMPEGTFYARIFLHAYNSYTGPFSAGSSGSGSGDTTQFTVGAPPVVIPPPPTPPPFFAAMGTMGR